MPRATAHCPAPSPMPSASRPAPNAPHSVPRAKCPARNAPREMPRTQCPTPNARAQCPASTMPREGRGGERAAGRRSGVGCVGAARRRTGPPAALAAGALSAVSDTFGWELDTRPKNRLPVEFPPKLNLQPLELRPALLPLLLSPSGPSPARSIARRSSSFQASERRPSSATAFFCAALTPWLRLGWGATCPAADGPAAAAAAPSASSCAGRSTASGVAITRTNLLARGCGAQPVTWGGAKRAAAILCRLWRGGAWSGARFWGSGTELVCPRAMATILPARQKVRTRPSTLRCAREQGNPF